MSMNRDSMRLFVENPGRLLTRNLLFDRLWGDEGEYVDENALSVTVNRLRRKLENKKTAYLISRPFTDRGICGRKRRKRRKDGQPRKQEG